MKKKSSQAKKVAVKKAVPKKKKAVPKKAVPKKAALRSVGSRGAGLAESFRPICLTENKRLSEECMTEKEAFDIAQAHRKSTSPRHSVDVESC